jgi:hypothetical protein
VRILLVALLVLLSAAPADAGWRINRSLAIAQEVWKPSCGQLRLAYGNPADYGVPGADEWAWPEKCAIGIDTSKHFEFEELCTIVLHGAGHVAGAGHSDRPQSIMYPYRVFSVKVERVRGREVFTNWGGVDRRCLDR